MHVGREQLGLIKRSVRCCCLKGEWGCTVRGADRFSRRVSVQERKAVGEQTRRRDRLANIGNGQTPGQAWQAGLLAGQKTGLDEQEFGLGR